MEIDNLLKLYNLDPALTNLYRKVKEGRTVAVFSAGEGEKIHIASHLDKFVLFVAKDAFKATVVFNRLKDYYGDRVGLLPANEELLLLRKTYFKSIISQRINTLYDWAAGKLDCVVVTPQSLLQYVPRKKNVKDSVIKLSVGDKLDRYELIDRLALTG